MRPQFASKLALVACGLAACHPMPMIKLKNDTASGATLRFQTPDGGYLESVYKVEPRAAARFPAGYLVRQRIVLASGACEAVWPLIAEGVVDGRYGAVTPLRFAVDGRLYVNRARGEPQPQGWPLAPEQRTCPQPPPDPVERRGSPTSDVRGH